jgi:hypothetical protein
VLLSLKVEDEDDGRTLLPVTSLHNLMLTVVVVQSRVFAHENMFGLSDENKEHKTHK